MAKLSDEQRKEVLRTFWGKESDMVAVVERLLDAAERAIVERAAEIVRLSCPCDFCTVEIVGNGEVLHEPRCVARRIRTLLPATAQTQEAPTLVMDANSSSFSENVASAKALFPKPPDNEREKQERVEAIYRAIYRAAMACVSPKQIRNAIQSALGDLLHGPTAAETLTVPDNEREIVAKALWDASREKAGDAQWPGPPESHRQPYCQWAYKTADTVLAKLRRAGDSK